MLFLVLVSVFLVFIMFVLVVLCSFFIIVVVIVIGCFFVFLCVRWGLFLFDEYFMNFKGFGWILYRMGFCLIRF